MQIFAITKIFVQEINFPQRQNFSVWPSLTRTSALSLFLGAFLQELVSTFIDSIFGVICKLSSSQPDLGMLFHTIPYRTIPYTIQ